MSLISGLWACEDEAVWRFALKTYWLFVKGENRGLEEALEHARERAQGLDPKGWYDFLLNEYFPWKFAPPFLAAHQNTLRRHVSQNGLDGLYEIKRCLFALDPANPENTERALKIADGIPGLATSGASGLVTVLFPEHFGTVDQFVVRALQSIDGLPHEELVRGMKPMNFTPQEAATVIKIMRKKAGENNLKFRTDFWTPRRMDMILWTYGRENE